MSEGVCQSSERFMFFCLRVGCCHFVVCRFWDSVCRFLFVVPVHMFVVCRLSFYVCCILSFIVFVVFVVCVVCETHYITYTQASFVGDRVHSIYTECVKEYSFYDIRNTL